MRGLILGAAVGECVHVAGVVNFLGLAEAVGYRTVFLGPAVPVPGLLAALERYDPDMVAVGYRLTPEAWERVLREIVAGLTPADRRRRWLFGGTEPNARIAAASGLFADVFDSRSTPQDALAVLREEAGGKGGSGQPPQTLVERILWKHPYPLIRHHFGQPTVAATEVGIAAIADAGVLDVVSLGPDQNAQEHFFRPQERDPAQDGAGGVPVRTPEDLRRLYAASRRGNYPLMRCYSGTRDTLRWAPLLVETIHNAWLATPLFWYSVLDGRSRRPLRQSIPEAQQLMRWHAERGIPVEMNESHHWSLRDAPDVVAVAAAYLAARSARAAGVQDYVQQLMFNTPAGTSPAMDLAKMLAKLDLVESLTTADFRVWRETRGGLTSFPADPDVAKGHLAATTFLQMQLRPHIVHVVAASEAHHAATAEDVIENCRIAGGAIRQALLGLGDMSRDPAVAERRTRLVSEARLLLGAIAQLAPAGTPDPLTDPETLARAVEAGLLDAPHLRENPAARGEVVTRLAGGASVAVDPETGAVLAEADRIRRLLGHVPEPFALEEAVAAARR